MALSTTNLLGTNPAQSALSAKINPSPLAAPTSGSLTPAFNALSANTKPFNPATVGQFNTTPAPAPINFGAQNLNGSGNAQGLVSLPTATLQNNAVQSAPVSTATGSSAPAAYTPTGTTPLLPNPTPTPSTQGLISNPAATYNSEAAAAANTNPAIADNSAAIAANYGSQIANVGNLGAGTQAGDLTTGTSPVGEGNAAVASNAESNRISALGTAENAALAGPAQQLTAANQQANVLNTATSNALPVTQYGALTNPFTGNAISSGATTGTGSIPGSVLPTSAQSFITSLAQQVQSGSMTRATAEGELGAYGPAGLTDLNTALGSGFNTNASNASAATTATGQQLQTAATTANQALDTLASSFAALPGFETGGIPLTNGIAQWIGTNLGQGALSNFTANLADARAQLVGALNTAGGTPTGNEATALQYLPDNMTPAQFQQNVGTAQNPGIVRQLLQQKVSSFTQSGQQSNTSNVAGGGGGIYQW